ncbi:MAG: glucose-6-phosphate dehydrogenase [Candidatus Woesearchaeota archaeon]
MNERVSFIIFGGTGDLTQKKLVPAFAQLLEQGSLAKGSLIIGIARSPYTSESYKQLLLQAAKTKKQKDAIEHLQIVFYQADSAKPGTLKELCSVLKKHEQGSHQRVFYLATTYTLFGDILTNLESEKLIDKKVKVVFEKPFGYDLRSARKLERQICSKLDESQIYRIDHYLGKETVQNVTTFKFANPILGAMLSNAYVEKIEVIADEDMGVENRLGYYATTGAVRDMVQNHLLQLLALVIMDRPKTLNPESIHRQKVLALKKLYLGNFQEQTLGQYHSFLEQIQKKNFIGAKQTETFCSLTFYSRSPKWKGVAFQLRTGKKLDKKYGRVVVHFRQPKDTLPGQQPNKMIIDIHPSENIQLFFNTKAREDQKLTQVSFDYCGECVFGPNTTDGYKKLLFDIISGDKTLFIHHNEIIESWKLVEEVLKKKHTFTFVRYKDGSNSNDISNRR